MADPRRRATGRDLTVVHLFGMRMGELKRGAMGMHSCWRARPHAL